MKSLLLDQTAWDICLDAAGNLAVCSEPYSMGQDVSCALRTFAGEVWYDNTLGVPYFSTILGKAPPIQLFKEFMVQAAMTVPGVVNATCVIEAFNGRNVAGYVSFTNSNGVTQTISIS